MIKKACLLLIFSLLILIFQITGQNQIRVDSLQAKLKKEKTDTLKADSLNELSKEYIMAIDYQKSGLFANQALILSQKTAYTKGILTSYMCLIYSNNLDWIKGKQYYEKAIELSIKLKDKSIIAKINFDIADFLSGLNQFNPEKYAKKALEIYIELKDSIHQAETYYKLSEIYAFWNKSMSKGNPEIALKYLDESFRIYKKLNNISGIMDCYDTYSNIYKLYYANATKTKEYLDIATQEINHRIKLEPNNKICKIRQHILYFHVAMFYSEVKHDFGKAELQLNLAISLAKELDKSFPKDELNHSMLGVYYRHLGQLYLDNNQLANADNSFTSYIQNFDQKNISKLCFALLEVEWFYRNKGMLAISYEYIDKASDIARKSDNGRLQWQTQYYLADLYQLMEDNATGIDLYKKCFNVAKQGNHYAGQIVSLIDVSKLFAKIDQLDSSYSYNKKAEKLNESSIQDTILYVWTLNNYASIYEKKKDYHKALEIHLKVLEIRNHYQWNQTIETPYGYIATNSCLARVYLELNEIDKAFDFVQKSLSSFQFVKYPEVERDDYLTLSEIYEFRNQTEKAFEYYKKYISERDKILSEQNQRKIQLTEIEKIKSQKKSEIDKLNIQNQLNESQLNKQQYLIYSFIIGFILLLTLAVVIYQSYRNKSKANRLLKINEEELIERNKRLFHLNEEIKAQNEEIKAQNDEIKAQNDEITIQRDLLTKQKDKITDSIVYASLIQQALLPTTEILKDCFSQHFILFKPRDIVSGDFYWFKRNGKFVYLAVADGTGHGVPGAFMSTLGISLLNDALNRNEIKSPDIILSDLRERIKDSMQQKSTQDGMDMALCLFNTETNVVQFSGANIPIYIYRNNELIKFNADHMPIGEYPKDKNPFTLTNIQLYKNDILYIYTDGFVSQLGGNKLLKFSSKRFHDKLESIHGLELNVQKQVLEQTLLDWRGNYGQVDDILVIAIKI